MNIALLGFGQMGQLDKAIGHKKGTRSLQELLTLVLTFNPLDFTECRRINVDFRTAGALLFDNIAAALKSNTPVVSGTTGWTEKMDEIHQMAIDIDTSFLYQPTLALGSIYSLKLISVVGKIMKQQTDYSANIEEIHHTEKLDIPSGTPLAYNPNCE